MTSPLRINPLNLEFVASGIQFFETLDMAVESKVRISPYGTEEIISDFLLG